MLNALRLQASTPARLNCVPEKSSTAGFSRSQLDLRLNPSRHLAYFRVKCTNSTVSDQSRIPNLTSTVGSPGAVFPIQGGLTHRHIQFLSYAACAAAISATCLFCAAIPALLAFKRAAESLEKLMDTAREELPSTMAAVRLSGMELSDLTMELSDIGQGITRGIRSSTQTVRMAEESLRRLTNFTPTVTMQEVARNTDQTVQPVLARTARGLREGIVKGRGVLRMFFMLIQYSRTFQNFFRSRAKVQ